MCDLATAGLRLGLAAGAVVGAEPREFYRYSAPRPGTPPKPTRPR